jgi:hypothetical protein
MKRSDKQIREDLESRMKSLKNQPPVLKPEIGQKIYVPSSLYVYRGQDDFAGGIATINKIEESKTLSKDHYNYLMVGIAERPNSMYNWRPLLERQEELKKMYADQIAHPDPDLRPEFNDENADWR